MIGENFFCFLPVIPVRAAASDPSEIVTQLLFGEVGEILEFEEPWLKIKNAHDGYEGYIDYKQIFTISNAAKEEILNSGQRQKSALLSYNTPIGPIQTLKGSMLNENLSQFKVDDYSFEKITQNNSPSKHANIGEVALEFLNAPYLWGGRTQFGIDCSGFTQAVLREFGVELLRDASMQVTQGIAIGFEDIQVGDLAFFSNSKDKVTHVGILLEDNKIIHASGRVKIETLNKEGIFSTELNKQTHRLTHLRRYLI
ncbi:Cell wall-associated hydrolase, NlpC family [Lishizhenia tianjinensis]|uniref:Cell wall-associated hydrolase, NlpC family n=1 Tax=Lishizhenia tianjinensis TaxID=477690 RepID=A0A1I6XWU5_9FLAO|nr:C40 family peptidase [Lishizhenia tianjinensis]SFT42770.1 Cell wall-associated hydrolase, NlpC family [Lishizhenia tianjinensis]